jgi:hypothetical protein
MQAITNLKLPIGLVSVIVAQAMGLAVWINTLQGGLSSAQATAEAAQAEVARLEEVLQQTQIDMAILRETQRDIDAAHASFGDAFDEVWAAVRSGVAIGPDPAPDEVKRKYGY